MDRQSLRRDQVQRLLGHRPIATPEELQEFVRRTLARFPTASFTETRDRIVAIEIPPMIRKRAERTRRRLREHYRGTFDYRHALGLEFLAFGAPVVDELVDLAAEPGFAPPLCVLESPDVAEPGLLGDYELHCSGARWLSERRSYLADTRGVHQPPSLDPPSEPKQCLTIEDVDPDWLQALERACRKAMYADLRLRRAEFERRQQADHDEERERITRRIGLQVAQITARLKRDQERLDRIERTAKWDYPFSRTGYLAQAVGLTPEQIEAERRTLPLARAGTGGREPPQGARAQREETLANLDERRKPTISVEPLGVTLDGP